MAEVAFLPAGDRALAAEFGDAIDEGINAAVVALDAAVAAAALPGVTETVPTYRSLLVYYDPSAVRYRVLVRRLRKLLRTVGDGDSAPAGRTFEIPVLYGGAAGEDLADVAGRAGLSEAEVVERHSSREYRIYMLGFLPGFAYLGGMDPALATPRLPTPRQAIPAGSVGIAGEQTGIYPSVSPGGWRLIGRTPVKPYDPARTPPFLYGSGDRIRFVPIDEAEYERIGALVASGAYSCAVAGGGIAYGT